MKVKLKEKLTKAQICEETSKHLENDNIGSSMTDFFYTMSMLTNGVEIYGEKTPCSDFFVPEGNDCIISCSIIEVVGEDDV